MVVLDASGVRVTFPAVLYPFRTLQSLQEGHLVVVPDVLRGWRNHFVVVPDVLGLLEGPVLSGLAAKCFSRSEKRPKRLQSDEKGDTAVSEAATKLGLSFKKHVLFTAHPQVAIGKRGAEVANALHGIRLDIVKGRGGGVRPFTRRVKRGEGGLISSQNKW